MSATEARIHFGEVLQRVENNESITVERCGQSKALILSISEYEKLKAVDHRTESWEDRMTRARERYLREAGDVRYDVEENMRQMREERSHDLNDRLR